MAGLVFFNSDLPSSPFLEPYQMLFSGSEDFLDHDSYLDCAQLYEESKGWITLELSSGKESGILGRLSEKHWDKVKSLIKSTPIIERKYKKKYDLL